VYELQILVAATRSALRIERHASEEGFVQAKAKGAATARRRSEWIILTLDVEGRNEKWVASS